MARCERGKLDPPAEKKRVGVDGQGVRPLARDAVERQLNLVAGAGIEDLNLQPASTRSHPHVPRRGFGLLGIRRIDGYSRTNRSGQEFTQKFQPFCGQLGIEKINACQIAAGRARLATRASLTGSSDVMKTMGSVVVAALAANVRRITSGSGNHRDLPADQIGCHRRQPIGLVFGPAIFDRDVLAFDIAGLLKSLPKCAHALRVTVRRQAA